MFIIRRVISGGIINSSGVNRDYGLAAVCTGVDCHHAYPAERMEITGQQAVAVFQRIPVGLAQGTWNIPPVTRGVAAQQLLYVISAEFIVTVIQQ